MQALIFDTETTGLIDNHTVSIDKQPYIIEFCGQLVDLERDELIQEFQTLVKPIDKDGNRVKLPLNVKGNKGIADLTGITEQMLDDAPPLKDAIADIIALVNNATVVIAHNAAFDVEMCNVEFERHGFTLKWPRVICTVEQTMHLRGHRLTLSKLYAMLFNGETFEAHRAINDVQALRRVCVELFKRGML